MNLLDLDGYIAVYRELLGKPIWQKSTPEQKTVLITLLLMANHKEMEWEWQGKKFKVFPGQFITSLDGIKKACGKGITTQNVRSALKRFEKYEFLTDSSTKTGRLITILKWHTYQVEKVKTNKDSNKEVTKRSQRGHKEVTPNKNDNNDNNDNNLIIMTPEECEYIKTLESIKNYPLDRQVDLDYYKELEARYPQVDLVGMIKDYAAYKKDKPLNKKCKPRSQINSQCKLNIEWGKNLKGGSKSGSDRKRDKPNTNEYSEIGLKM